MPNMSGSNKDSPSSLLYYFPNRLWCVLSKGHDTISYPGNKDLIIIIPFAYLYLCDETQIHAFS